MKIIFIFLFLLFCISAQAQSLSSVKKIYLGNFDGNKVHADTIRENIRMQLQKRSRFQVVESEADADATLTASVWIVQTQNDHAAAAYASGTFRLVNKKQKEVWTYTDKGGGFRERNVSETINIFAESTVKQLLKAAGTKKK